MSSSNCCFLICIQVSQEAGQVVWYSHLLKNFPQFVIHTVKGFGIVNKADIDVFLELSSFFECWVLSQLFHSPLSLSSRGSLVLLHFLPWVMSSACLRLLIFLPAILILACASFSSAFLMTYSAYKLNKQGDNIQSWCNPFPILNQSIVPCPVLTVASWPAYKFLKRQIRWSGIPISFRIFHSLWSTQSKALA